MVMLLENEILITKTEAFKKEHSESLPDVMHWNDNGYDDNIMKQHAYIRPCRVLSPQENLHTVEDKTLIGSFSFSQSV